MIVSFEDSGRVVHHSSDDINELANIIREKLDPQNTIGFESLRSAVAGCLGLDIEDFRSGSASATAVFPNHQKTVDKVAYQRNRERRILYSLLPNVSAEQIDEFISSWSLLRWPSPQIIQSPTVERVTGSRTSVKIPKRRLKERENMGRLLPLQTTDRFIPPSINFASECAVALASIDHSISPSVANHITATVFGYTEWGEIETSSRSNDRSRFDEELCEADVLQRLVWQTFVLTEYLGLRELYAMQVQSKWRPTSRSRLLQPSTPESSSE